MNAKFKDFNSLKFTRFNGLISDILLFTMFNNSNFSNFTFSNTLISDICPPIKNNSFILSYFSHSNELISIFLKNTNTNFSKFLKLTEFNSNKNLLKSGPKSLNSNFLISISLIIFKFRKFAEIIMTKIIKLS